MASFLRAFPARRGARVPFQLGARVAGAIAVALGATFIASPAGAGPVSADAVALDELSPAFLGMYRKVQELEPEIRRHAEKYGVDPALAEAVCLYESGGNASLTSAAGARGYFQVMPSTYRALGVQDNIEAGIKYLGQLVARFGREDYALAAYNGGPTRVGRGGSMPLESLQYVIGVGGYRSVLQQYGPVLREYARDVRLATVRSGDTWWTLSQRLDVPLVQLRMHNPFLATRPLRAGYTVAYPATSRADFFVESEGQWTYRVRVGDNYLKLAFVLGIEPDLLRASNGIWRLQTVLPGSRLVLPADPEARFASYVVRAGDDLGTIATQARVDPWAIVVDNALWDESVVEGMRLRIREASTARAAAPRAPVKVVVHRVRAGENLTAIARRYGTTVDAIQDANGLGRRTVIVPGQRLRLSPR